QAASSPVGDAFPAPGQGFAFRFARPVARRVCYWTARSSTPQPLAQLRSSLLASCSLLRVATLAGRIEVLISYPVAGRLLAVRRAVAARARRRLSRRASSLRRSAPRDTHPARFRAVPANRKSARDRCATRQSPWAPVRPSRPAENIQWRLPCLAS